MKRFWLTLLLCVFFVASSAQQLIFGSVRDGFLKTPLEKARETLGQCRLLHQTAQEDLHLSDSGNPRRIFRCLANPFRQSRNR